MAIIMGGSGSTGSSLVKNILHRHKAIFSGGETAFFSKRMIYYNWKKARSRVQKRKYRGIKNFGFHLYNGTDMTTPEYLHSEAEIDKMLMSSDSLKEFTDRFYDAPLHLKGANLWMEKTPANAACFRDFLDYYPEGKAIHMVRNPYDTIASLWHRGYDVYYSTGIYLLNTASAIEAARYTDRYHEVKYEEVIAKPVETIARTCQFLGLTFDASILESRGEKIADSKLKGWNYDETANIGKGAVGRFLKLSDEKQSMIYEAINLISISSRGRAYYGVSISTIEEICHHLGYDYYPVVSTKKICQLRKLKQQDQLNRLKRGYITGINYPLQLKSK